MINDHRLQFWGSCTCCKLQEPAFVTRTCVALHAVHAVLRVIAMKHAYPMDANLQRARETCIAARQLRRASR